MIQINLLFIHLDVHLHRDQFEIFCIILPQVLHVMITGYEIDFPIQPFEYLCPFSRATKTEVAKMKYDIIRTDPRFQLAISVSFMCSTSLNGLLQNRMILV